MPDKYITKFEQGFLSCALMVLSLEALTVDKYVMGWTMLICSFILAFNKRVNQYVE